MQPWEVYYEASEDHAQGRAASVDFFQIHPVHNEPPN